MFIVLILVHIKITTALSQLTQKVLKFPNENMNLISSDKLQTTNKENGMIFTQLSTLKLYML